MSYTKTQWQNDQEPAINAENLNKMEQGIYDAHQIAEEKVDKVTGKGLSTNDYTNVDKAEVAKIEGIEEDIESLDLTKANIDGYYDTLSVGLADNLIDRKGNGTPQEISYRTSCGDDSIADDGNGIIQSIFGKTVVWNQLLDRAYKISPTIGTTVDGISFSLANDGKSVRVSGTSENTVDKSIYLNVSFVIGHKYVVLSSYAFTGTTQSGIACYVDLGGTHYANAIFSANHDISSVYVKTQRGLTIDATTTINVIDLTQMFGSGNEPTSVDDPRIEWIKQYASAHPEYNSGELISYNGSGIKTVGFNQMDSLGKVKVIKGLQYEVVGTKTGLAYSDGTGITLSNNLFTADRDDIVTVSGFSSNTCVHLTWSGYRNGEYEPYWSRTLALPISTYFPDGMKSAGSVRDEMTKDKAVKRFNTIVIDGSGNEFSEVSTATTADGTRYVAYINKSVISDMLPVKDNACLSDKFMWRDTGIDNLHEGEFNSRSGYLRFVIPSSWNITTLAQFKTWLSNNPLTLQYEITTPIETTITPPLNLTYKVADFGTEESVAEGKSTPFNGIVKYSDDFTRGLVNMPKNYDTTASLDALATSLSTMLTSALDGTVTITRGAYDSTNKKYAWNCSFTPNA